MGEGNCFWISPAPFTLKIIFFVLQDRQSLVSSNLSIINIHFTVKVLPLFYLFFKRILCFQDITLYFIYCSIKNYIHCMIISSRKHLKVKTVPRYSRIKITDCVTNQKVLQEAADYRVLLLTYKFPAAKRTYWFGPVISRNLVLC